jgi:excisionase family DNA binding protein
VTPRIPARISDIHRMLGIGPCSLPFPAIDATEEQMLLYSNTVNEQQQKTRLLKAEDIAVMLGLKVQTVYTMARRGELEKVKLSRKCLRFRADDVERFIERKAGLSL